MSLLLDALQRSERTLSLTPTDDAAPAATAPGPVEPPPSAVPAPEVAPPPPVRPAPAAAAAREAAQTMVRAAAPPDARARTRRMVFGLLTGLVLSVASWLGWNYWQASQTGLMAVASLPVASVPAQPAEPGPAMPPPVDGAAPAAAAVDSASLPAEPAASAAVLASPARAAQMPVAAARKEAPEAAPVRPKPPVSPRASAAPAAQDPAAPAAAAPARPAPAGRDAVASGAPRPRPATSLAAPELVRSLAQRHLQEAWAALGQGDAARAQTLYRQVLAERPDDPDATLGLAVALHRQKQLQEAWTAYQRSLQLWPDNATARTGLLAILSESDPATAESRLQEWVQTRPRDAAAQAALGNLLGRQGRWAEALGPLTLAQSLAPEQAAYAYNLAVALDQSRRYAEALRLYRQALQLGGAGIPVKSIEYRQAELQELLSQ